MDIDTVYAALQTIHDHIPTAQVHLTGGEPFLNLPLLLESVKIARQFGIPTRVETNASWCTHPGKVDDAFSILHEAGLGAVLISCTPFHAETIPLTRTLLAIDKALAIFGPHNVFVFLPEGIDQLLRFGTRSPVPLERFIETYGMDPAGFLLWEEFGLLSGGRAGYRLGHLVQRKPVDDFIGESCTREILFSPCLLFDLYENLIPGPCAGLSLGSWKHVHEIRGRISTGSLPVLVKILVDAGPYGLFCFARDQYHYRPLPQGYAGKCHLCVDVRKYLKMQADFPELEPVDYYRYD